MKNKNVSVSGVDPEGPANAFRLHLVNDELSNLLGQILTVIDASTEGEKNKAMKDLVRERFNTKQNFFFELAYKSKEGQNEGHMPINYWESGLTLDDGKNHGFRI